MNIVMIHGQNHKGSTYHIGRMLTDKLGGIVTEFFLPRDFGEFCIGCTSCFMKRESLCPHYERLIPITEAMDEADVLIFTSPVYVLHTTGPMKTFLDHYGYRFMIHRPEERMFHKQAVCISTAAGAGMKSANKDIADSLFFWGIPAVYQYGVAVHATSFDKIEAKTKRKIEKKITALAQKITSRQDKVKPGLKTIGFFHIVRMIQKMGWNEVDCEYWQAKGWSGKERPWNTLN